MDQYRPQNFQFDAERHSKGKIYDGPGCEI